MPEANPPPRPFEVPRSLYPFEDHWLHRDGGSLHYLDEGTGPPVLLLHGNPTWSFLYREVLRALRTRFRCVAPDYPGFGFSRPPEGYGYTPPEHRRWVARLLKHLDVERPVLVLHDWGGPIGLNWAVESPRAVRGIVLLNSWCWRPGPLLDLFSRILGSPPGRWFLTRTNAFPRWLLPLGIAHYQRLTPRVHQAYTDPFPTVESRRGTWVFPRSIRACRSWVQRTESGLPRLHGCPVEGLFGTRDPVFGRGSVLRRWHRLLPQLRVTRLPQASHYVPEDCPEAVVQGVERVFGRSSE